MLFHKYSLTPHNSFFLTNSLNVLTEEISEAVECPIIVTDSTFHIVSAYSSFEYKNDVFKRAIMHSELSIEACAEITKHSKESEDTHFLIESKDSMICVGVLINAGVFIGYVLYFLSETEDNFCDEKELTVCESLLAKQLYFELHECLKDAKNNKKYEEQLIKIANHINHEGIIPNSEKLTWKLIWPKQFIDDIIEPNIKH